MMCKKTNGGACRKLLVFNPHKRLSVQEALRHPYVAQFHDADNEPACPKIIVLPISDNTKYTVQEYRWGFCVVCLTSCTYHT